MGIPNITDRNNQNNDTKTWIDEWKKWVSEWRKIRLWPNMAEKRKDGRSGVVSAPACWEIRLWKACCKPGLAWRATIAKMFTPLGWVWRSETNGPDKIYASKTCRSLNGCWMRCRTDGGAYDCGRPIYYKKPCLITICNWDVILYFPYKNVLGCWAGWSQTQNADTDYSNVLFHHEVTKR